MATVSPSKMNVMWGGVGLGVFIGIGIFALSVVLFMVWASVDAAGRDAANDAAALWIVGGFLCMGGIIPAAIVGAGVGGILGAFYNRRSQPLATTGATFVGMAVGAVVVGFSYISVRGFVGSAEWNEFLGAYGAGGSLLGVVAPYTILVFLGFILLSHRLNGMVATRK